MTAPVIMRCKYKFSAVPAQGRKKCRKSMIAVCMNYIIIVLFEISVDLRRNKIRISRSKRSEPDNLYSIYHLSLTQFSRGISCYNLNIMSCFNKPFTNFFDMSFHSTYIWGVTGTDLGYFQG